MRPSTLLPLALFAATPALADEGDDVLAQVDARLGNFEDQSITFEVANAKPGASTPSRMVFETIVKGGKSYTSFLAPGDVKGQRVLSMSSTQMWVYLPDFGKIRRVASHALSQGFMGTTLTQQDMGTLAYTPDYDAELIGQDDSSYTLKLVARDADTTAYDTLVMVVDKEKLLPTKIEYKADDGTVVRTQTRENYQCPKPDYCLFGEMKMVDHTTGAWTTLSPVKAAIDTGISDDIFTPRSLQLGL